MASRPCATLALCWVTTPDAASWGPPLMYHVGEKVTRLPTETNPMSPSLSSRNPSKNRPWAMPETVRTVSKILEPIWQGRTKLAFVARSSKAKISSAWCDGRSGIRVSYVARNSHSSHDKLFRGMGVGRELNLRPCALCLLVQGLGSSLKPKGESHVTSSLQALD